MAKRYKKWIRVILLGPFVLLLMLIGRRTEKRKVAAPAASNYPTSGRPWSPLDRPLTMIWRIGRADRTRGRHRED